MAPSSRALGVPLVGGGSRGGRLYLADICLCIIPNLRSRLSPGVAAKGAGELPRTGILPCASAWGAAEGVSEAGAAAPCQGDHSHPALVVTCWEVRPPLLPLLQ